MSLGYWGNFLFGGSFSYRIPCLFRCMAPPSPPRGLDLVPSSVGMCPGTPSRPKNMSPVFLILFILKNSATDFGPRVQNAFLVIQWFRERSWRPCWTTTSTITTCWFRSDLRLLLCANPVLVHVFRMLQVASLLALWHKLPAIVQSWPSSLNKDWELAEKHPKRLSVCLGTPLARLL